MIRVIRLMEYTYPDVETMDKNMMQWYISPNGSRRITTDRLIRSAVIIEPIFPEEE